MKKKTLAACILIAGAGCSAVAFAHGGATGIVKERMDGMMAMGKALGIVADMFKGKTSFNAAQVTSAAKTVEIHAAEMIELFPDTKHSRQGKGTEALPAIWQDKDEFNALARLLETKSQELGQIAASGDQVQVRRAFAEAAKVCSACHQDYRKPSN